MPDTTPAYKAALTGLLDRLDQHLDELNVAVAYVPDLANRAAHLTGVQDLADDLAALRTDVDAL